MDTSALRADQAVARDLFDEATRANFKLHYHSNLSADAKGLKRQT